MCLNFSDKLILQRIPVAHPEGVDGPVEVKVISGKSHGVESPVRPLGGCWFFHIVFKKGRTMFQELRRIPITSVPLTFSCILSLASGWTSFLYSKRINLGQTQLFKLTPSSKFWKAPLQLTGRQYQFSILQSCLPTLAKQGYLCLELRRQN